jgi:hypothetical protein
MNIREALRAEHSKRQTMAIVEHIGSDPKRFAELMSIFFEGEYRLTQRAAWPMNYCAERQPQLISPYLSRLVNQLERDDVHDAVKRNALRLMQFVDVPSRLKGKTYSICVELIADPLQPVAVKVFAVTVAAKIARPSPDLMKELRLVVKETLRHSSVALRKRAREVM